MKYRSLGRTGWKISEISFGAWAIGGAWGTVDDKESLATLHAALDGHDIANPNLGLQAVFASVALMSGSV